MALKLQNNCIILSCFMLIGILSFIDIFPVLKQLNITHFQNIFNQSIETKLLIKNFATKGIQVLFYGLLGIYTLLMHKSTTQTSIKRGLVVTSLILVFGKAGEYVHSFKGYSINYGAYEFKSLEKGKINAQIAFTDFPGDLKSYLQKVQNGEIYGYIKTFLLDQNSNLVSAIKVDGSNLKKGVNSHFFHITPENAMSLLNRPKMEVSATVVKGASLYVRDFGEEMHSRIDKVFFNDKIITLGKDKCVLISFLFEDLHHKPLKVFL